MAETTEAKACKALLRAVGDITFNPHHFAQVLVNTDPVLQKRLAELFRAVAEVSAIALDYGVSTDVDYPYLAFYDEVRRIPLTPPVL